jgi:hypothetical protein
MAAPPWRGPRPAVRAIVRERTVGVLTRGEQSVTGDARSVSERSP